MSIKVEANGLYRILMDRGGARPRICEELFTSYRMAKEELEKYLRETDRGYAQYPSKKELVSAKSEDE